MVNKQGVVIDYTNGWLVGAVPRSMTGTHRKHSLYALVPRRLQGMDQRLGLENRICMGIGVGQVKGVQFSEESLCFGGWVRHGGGCCCYTRGMKEKYGSKFLDQIHRF